MKRILLLWLVLVCGLADAQNKIPTPVFVPRATGSKIKAPKQDGEHVFIDASDSKLKGKNGSGQIRELGGSGTGSGFRFSPMSAEPTTATSGPGGGQSGDFYFKSSTNELFLRINELATDSKVLKFAGVSILGYSGQISNKWASPIIQSISTTANSATIIFTNPNAGANVRADYSTAASWGGSAADVNDNSGTKWRYGTNIAGPATGGVTQSLTITGLSSSTLYYFRYIVYGEGKTDSDWTYAGGQSTGSAAESLTVPVLTASVTGYDATITWTDNSVGHTSYTLQRKLSIDASWYTVSSTIAPTARQYIDYSLAGGSTYQYQMRANGPTTTGNYSSAVSVTTGTSAVPVPTISATLLGDNTFRIDFADATTQAAYEIQRRTGGTGSFSTLVTLIAADVASTGKVYYDSPIVENVLYEYRIRAKNVSNNWSAYSSPVAIQKNSSGSGGGGPAGPDLGVTGNTEGTTRVSSYMPTMAQIYAAGYDLDANFSRKDYTPVQSPFWNSYWGNELGATAGKPLVTSFGFGAYYLNNSSWNEVPYAHKIHELSQTGTFQLFGKDHDMICPTAGPQGSGVTYQTDWGTIELVQNAGNYFHNWASLDYLSVDFRTVSSAGAEGAIVRYDVEHLEFNDMQTWIGHRNTWRTVDYRKTANGGTNPLYKNMSDADWYSMFLDHVTRIYVSLYKKTIASIQSRGGTPVVLFYGCVNPSSVIWNRRVQIDGVDQPTIAELAGAANMNDKVVGHTPFFIDYPTQNWANTYLDRARPEVTPKETLVTGKPSRYRVIQTNATSSLRPTLRVRMEDEDGNICRDQDGVVYAFHTRPWRSSGSPATDQVMYLRSEGSQNPDITFTLDTDVDLTWWQTYANDDVLVDKAIASFFKTSVSDRNGNGTVRLFQQVYPYMVRQCSEMYQGQGQCEATVAGSLPVDVFNALWIVRSPRNFVTGLWQWDGAVQAQGLTDVPATRKGNVGYNSRVNSLKSLQTFDRYKGFYQPGTTFQTIAFDISYDGGTTWKNSTQYYAELETITSGKAAVEVVYNSNLNKVLIAGRPLYASTITPQIRYTVPGQAQVTKPLSLAKSREDGWTFYWYSTTL